MTGKKCSDGLNRGRWRPEEDVFLRSYIEANGVGRWSTLPAKAGLMRCGKSCRLRWMNHLRQNLKRGHISADEEELIIRLHKLLGNRWSLIAARLPGRTDSDVKNFWNIHLNKKLACKDMDKSVRKDKPAVSVLASESSKQFSLHPRKLNFQRDSISRSTEPKQIERPYNGDSDEFNLSSHEIAEVYSHLNSTRERVECPTTDNDKTTSPGKVYCDDSIGSDSIWFESLPCLGSNEDGKFYSDDSTCYFTDLQPFLSLI